MNNLVGEQQDLNTWANKWVCVSVCLCVCVCVGKTMVERCTNQVIKNNLHLYKFRNCTDAKQDNDMSDYSL